MVNHEVNFNRVQKKPALSGVSIRTIIVIVAPPCTCVTSLSLNAARGIGDRLVQRLISSAAAAARATTTIASIRAHSVLVGRHVVLIEAPAVSQIPFKS